MRQQRGVTFLELLFTLVLCSIISYVAVSSWAHFKQKNERHRLVNEIKSAIHYARIKAFSEGYDLMLVPVDENWSLGASLFDVSNKKHVLLQQWDWNNSYWLIRWHGVSGSTSLMISGTTQAINNGRFILEHRLTHQEITLLVNRLGRVRDLDDTPAS